MSYKFYKFCCRGFITVGTTMFVTFLLLFLGWKLPWWGAALITIPAVFIWLLPILNLVYPFAYAIYMIVAAIVLYHVSALWFWIVIVILALHIFRMTMFIGLSLKDPERSAEYDALYRNGV